MRRVLALLALPAHLTHELLHVLVAAPWARRVRLDIEPGSGTACRIDWGEEPAWPVIAASALAPMAAALIALAVGLWALLSGVVVVGPDPTEMALLAIAGAYVAMVGKPSAADLRSASPRTGGDGVPAGEDNGGGGHDTE